MLKTLKVRVLGVALFTMFLANSFVTALFIVLKPWLRKTTMHRYAGFMMTNTMTPWVQLQFNIGRLISYIPFMFQAQDQLFSFRNNMRTAGTSRLVL